jgi:hypothetical protein
MLALAVVVLTAPGLMSTVSSSLLVFGAALGAALGVLWVHGWPGAARG